MWTVFVGLHNSCLVIVIYIAICFNVLKFVFVLSFQGLFENVKYGVLRPRKYGYYGFEM